MRTNILSACLAFALCSCQDVIESEIKSEEQALSNVDIHCDCIIDEESWETSAPTRATILEVPVTRLAVKIFPEGDNTNAAYSVEQSKADDGFGILSDIRLSPGKYTAVAVAYKASTTDSKPATINSPQSITIQETAMPETYACVKEMEITSGSTETQSIKLTLNLCVTKATIAVLDKIPEGTKYMTLTVNSDKNAPSAMTFNPSTGEFTTDASFKNNWDVSNHVGSKGNTFSVMACLNSYPKDVDITITASDSNDKTIATKTFNAITLNRAKIRKIKTYLFTSSSNMDLTFEEWGNDEDMEIP